jgi:hypothetical protein
MQSIKYKGYIIHKVPAKPKYYIVVNHNISAPRWDRKLWQRFNTLKETKEAINNAIR